MIEEARLEAFRSWQIGLDHALSTARKSARYLRFFERRGLNLDPGALSHDAVLLFLASARQRGAKPRTMNSWIRELNLWSRFNRLGWKATYFRRRSGPPIQVPTREIVGKLFGLPYASPSVSARNHAILALLVGSGIRRNELVHLQLSDRVQLESGPGLRVRFGKGENERDVPIDPAVCDLLDLYVNQYRSSTHPSALFTTQVGAISYGFIDRVVREAGARAGAPWLSAHKLRHFFTDEALDAGMPVSSVASILGHRRWETTQLYRQHRLQKIRAEADFRAAIGSRFVFGSTTRRKMEADLPGKDSSTVNHARDGVGARGAARNRAISPGVFLQGRSTTPEVGRWP